MFAVLGLVMKVLPRELQFRIVANIAAQPQRVAATNTSFTQSATQVPYGTQREKAAWLVGEGPLVVCIHGWGGGGANDLGTLALSIAAIGFKVAVLDLTGHGESPGNRIGFGIFIDDIAEFFTSLNEPVYAAIGFSAGGLSMMAARAQHQLSASKWACIASPCAPYPPLNLATKKLKLSAAVAEKYRVHLAKAFKSSWEDITKNCFTPYDAEKLLLIYDLNDTFITHHDADTIAAFWPSAEVVKTRGNKHKAMLDAEEVILTVCRFLDKPERR